MTQALKLFYINHTSTAAHLIGFLVIVLGGGLMLALTPWQADSIFFILFGFGMFYWGVNSRIAIGLALAGLIAIMLLLALGSAGIHSLAWLNTDGWSERIAVWVYFFLVVGVVKQMWEYRGEHDADSDDAEQSNEAFSCAAPHDDYMQNPVLDCKQKGAHTKHKHHHAHKKYLKTVHNASQIGLAPSPQMKKNKNDEQKAVIALLSLTPEEVHRRRAKRKKRKKRRARTHS